MPHIAHLVAVAAFALVASGCGSAEAEPGPAPEPAPQQETTGPPMTAHAPDKADSRNRLGDETSPYLLQHQHNPVHWYPWGEEAFEAAREQDKPIFLSVGYSTCYWCHVMERESFEMDDVAEILNEFFISIKVDREERPDVDDIYMTAVNVLNRGRGGWPMSVWMEPQHLRPFFAGTYFPKEDANGRPGFKNVLRQIADAWATRRDAVEQQAEQVTQMVTQQMSQMSTPVPVGADEVQRGVAQLLSSYDGVHGGFGQRMKFPMPSNLELLVHSGWDNPSARSAVLYTLDRMAMGGIYDQIGGGFHRYATDVEWLVPHFEKMLYDNGQLASTYAEVYDRTKDAYYAEVLRETLDYVLREMTSSEGAFYSAQDAEVNHREGENYIWTSDQMRAALTEAGLADDVDFALEAYGLAAGTNFQDPHHPEDGRKNVVFLVGKPVDLAPSMDMTVEAFRERIRRVNKALLAVRDKRDQPGTDDKILTSWNGLMIAGMADAGRVLDERRYIDAARNAVAFILANMRKEDQLLRTYRAGRAKIGGFMEDYAFFIHGLLALHRATGEAALLATATELAAEARSRFWDEVDGAYFDTLPDQSDLFVRVKSTYDGAVPSANGVMLHNLLDLHEATGETTYLDDAARAISAISSELKARPTASVTSLDALRRIASTYPDRLDSEPAAPASTGGGLHSAPVRLTASVDELRLSPGTPASFEVELDLAPGYHLNSHEPGIEYLIPLEIKVAGGTGVTLDVDYPDGEKFAGPEGSMLVHHGRIAIPVRATLTGELAGAPTVMVTYQVCTDEVCLAPQTEVVPVRFLRAEK